MAAQQRPPLPQPSKRKWLAFGARRGWVPDVTSPPKITYSLKDVEEVSAKRAISFFKTNFPENKTAAGIFLDPETRKIIVQFSEMMKDENLAKEFNEHVFPVISQAKKE